LRAELRDRVQWGEGRDGDHCVLVEEEEGKEETMARSTKGKTAEEGKKVFWISRPLRFCFSDVVFFTHSPLSLFPLPSLVRAARPISLPLSLSLQIIN
jgi:hypothetical protein